MKSAIKNHFEKLGYYHAKNVFSREETKELEREFDKIVEQLVHSNEEINATWKGNETKKLIKANDQVIHTHNVHKYSSKWLSALRHPKFLEITQAILGEDIILHHNKLFQKPAERGAAFPVHQDWSYFPTINDTMIAAIIHLTRTTVDMGCLRVFECTHKLGRLSNTNGQGEFQHELLNQYPIEKGKIIEAEAGDVLFFHYFTLHGSLPNRSDKIRKTVLVQMHSGKDKVEEGNRHPNEHLVLNGWNYFATRNIAGKKG